MPLAGTPGANRHSLPRSFQQQTVIEREAWKGVGRLGDEASYDVFGWT